MQNPPTPINNKEHHMKAVIYARFSSDRQTEDSIVAQVRACNEYAERRGYTVLQVYADEAISGKESKTASRAQYQKMLSDARKGHFNVILIHKYDRIARSLAEHINLEKRLKDANVELVAVAQDFGSSAEAKIMRSLMWSLSEYYIDNLSAEVKKGHKETALQALHNGGYAPFGYDIVNQRYVINELEAGYVRRLFDAAINREGFKAIIDEMRAAGITGKRGKPIKYSQVYDMLRNEKYTGTYTYSPWEEASRSDRRTKPNAIKIENALPTIVSRAQFDEVQRIMDNRKQSGRKAGYMCSGLAYCSCGAKLHGFTSKRKGHEYKYYKCSAGCGAKMIHMESVDNAALEYVSELLSDKNQLSMALAMQKYKNSAKDRLEGFRAACNSRIKAKQEEYDSLLNNLSAGVLPPDVLKDIGERMQTIKAEIAELQNAEPPQDYSLETIKQWLDAIKAAPDEKAVKLLIERIDTENKENKTAFNIQSTLKTVLEIVVAGEGFVEYLKQYLPEILFKYYTIK